jgi:dTDP-4-dehydrorhamnose reductase
MVECLDSNNRMLKNVLVTGANGQLGNEMRVVSAEQSTVNFHFTDVAELDICDQEAIERFVVEHTIDCIVNCAAYTNVNKAEEDTELCDKLNHQAPANLARVAAKYGAALIHVSTDYVFGQEPYNTPCHPEQKGTPTGVYGATKKQGEENILASGCNHIILRTAWLYSEFGKNFCKTMLNLTATKPQLKVVFDQCGTPTYAYDLASAIYDIITNRKYEGNTGIYHYSNEGVTSWYDFTQMIAKIAGHKDCDIKPCYSSEYPSPVKRPAYSVLDKRTFKDTFNIKVPYWGFAQ